MRPDLLNIENYIPTLNDVDANLKQPESYWVHYVRSNREKEAEITKLYDRIKVLETIRGILSLLSLIVSQGEYEFIYYKKYYVEYHYPDTMDLWYDGTPIRCGLSFISLLLCILALIINYTYYLLKREQKKIINCK